MAPRTLQIKSEAADQHQSQNGIQYKMQCGAKNQHSIHTDTVRCVQLCICDTTQYGSWHCWYCCHQKSPIGDPSFQYKLNSDAFHFLVSLTAKCEA